jgi:hypothetical protein
MKKLILALMLTTSVFATTADVNCTVSGPLVVEGTFGTVVFNRAELDFTNLEKEDVSGTTLVMNDMFGTNYEVFNRLWTNRARCSGNSTCVNTDFSSLRGLSFEIPNSVFENDNQRFTMRVRQNATHRSAFANCTSSIR